METRSRFKVLSDKISVPAEPGLTSTQLMVRIPYTKFYKSLP